MAYPTPPNPGTVVPSGSLVTPSGTMGAQGPTGPTGVSTDAGNLAKLGSDNLVLVPQSAVIPSGIVWDYAGSGAAPTGWLLCDGTSYPTANYPNLFAAIGYTWGGSGANFNVPDLRGRVSIGAGQGAGLTTRVLAASGGEENHQLTIAELASHTHIQNAHNHQYAVPTTGTGIASGTQLGTPSANAATSNTTAVNQNAGSDGAHNNMQPYAVVNRVIKI